MFVKTLHENRKRKTTAGSSVGRRATANDASLSLLCAALLAPRSALGEKERHRWARHLEHPIVAPIGRENREREF